MINLPDFRPWIFLGIFGAICAAVGIAWGGYHLIMALIAYIGG